VVDETGNNIRFRITPGSGDLDVSDVVLPRTVRDGPGARPGNDQATLRTPTRVAPARPGSNPGTAATATRSWPRSVQDLVAEPGGSRRDPWARSTIGDGDDTTLGRERRRLAGWRERGW
jgi:hypothetical protein